MEPLSFRITRSTEGLAETLATLSHRLIKLEQRLAAMELQPIVSAYHQLSDGDGDATATTTATPTW